MYKLLKKYLVIIIIIVTVYNTYAESHIIYENASPIEFIGKAQLELTSKMAKLNIGDIIYFGSYEQDNNLENGKEPVAWIILGKDYDRRFAVLISVYLLDCIKFNGFNENVTWDNSSLRAYMNTTMYNEMFTEDEKKCIRKSHNANFPNPFYGTYSGVDTDDFLYIPSIVDMYVHFSTPQNTDAEKWSELLKPNVIRSARATSYAIAKGVRTSIGKNNVIRNGNYFLRTAGLNGYRIWYNDVYNEFYQSFVTEFGEIKPDGTGINSCDDGIRVMTQIYF